MSIKLVFYLTNCRGIGLILNNCKEQTSFNDNITLMIRDITSLPESSNFKVVAHYWNTNLLQVLPISGIAPISSLSELNTILKLETA